MFMLRPSTSLRIEYSPSSMGQAFQSISVLMTLFAITSYNNVNPESLGLPLPGFPSWPNSSTIFGHFIYSSVGNVHILGHDALYSILFTVPTLYTVYSAYTIMSTVYSTLAISDLYRKNTTLRPVISFNCRWALFYGIYDWPPCSD